MFPATIDRIFALYGASLSKQGVVERSSANGSPLELARMTNPDGSCSFTLTAAPGSAAKVDAVDLGHMAAALFSGSPLIPQLLSSAGRTAEALPAANQLLATTTGVFATMHTPEWTLALHQPDPQHPDPKFVNQ